MTKVILIGIIIMGLCVLFKEPLTALIMSFL